MDIKDKTYQILKDELLDKDGKFYVDEKLMDYLYEDMNEDYPIIKDKILKFVDKMNQMNEDELKKLMDADFQDEIFDKL